jgi:hypothetical protein
VLCYMTLPNGLIPPLIKRLRIIVNGSAVIVNLGKILIKLWLRVPCRKIPILEILYYN